MPQGIYREKTCKKTNIVPFTPQKHQQDVLDYFINESKYKGLLLYHRLGSGKSCSSILMSDRMIKESKVKKVYVFTPGSLRQNFINEYCNVCGYSPKFLKKHYIFITSNYAVGNFLPDFDDSLVIIDEVHNLINGVKNFSKHPSIIYKALQKSNCRILALTGTPIFNFVWEWPLLGNLLKPNTFTNIFSSKNEIDTKSFMSQFNRSEDGVLTPKRPINFFNKLKGIISYFPGSGKGFYPTVVYHDPIKTIMTTPQENAYWAIASWETFTRIKGPPDKKLIRLDPLLYKLKSQEFIMASKYVLSRKYSNFFYPLKFKSSYTPKSRDVVKHLGKIDIYVDEKSKTYAFEKNIFTKRCYTQVLENETIKECEKRILSTIKKEQKKDVIGWIDHENFDQYKLTDVYSRKITSLIVNITSNFNSKHVVFSFFKTKGGVQIVHSLFKLCGINTEMYTGDISESKRRNTLKVFNSEKNRQGDIIKVLLITEAGAEGINILEARHIHILESSPREMIINQAIGRVVRYRSHDVEGRAKMKKSDRVVHVWRYWSVSSPGTIKIAKKIKNSDGTTTEKDVIINKTATVDEILYVKGRLYINQMQSFLSLLKKSSVTPYDEKIDTTILQNYEDVPISPEIKRACDISDERYEKSRYDIDDIVVEEDINIENEYLEFKNEFKL